MNSLLDLIPDGPFLTSTAIAHGISSQALSRLARAEVLRHPMRGVYVPAGLADTLDLRARMAALVLPPHTVVSDCSAAWLYGIDLLGPTARDDPPELDVVSVGGADRSRAAGTRGGKRDLVAAEITSLRGVPVTTPVRTACDIACLRGRFRAQAALDAFSRAFGLTPADYARMLPRFAGRRGVTQLRELAPSATPDAESQPESWCRRIILDEQLPVPTPQAWVTMPDGRRYRLENAYPHLQVAVEYDSDEFHDTEEARAHDARRRAALRSIGWIIIVVRKTGFSGAERDAWVGELKAAIAERTEPPAGKRRYARGAERPAYRRRR